LTQISIDASRTVAIFASSADARAWSVEALHARTAVAIVDKALVEVNAASEARASESWRANTAFERSWKVDAMGFFCTTAVVVTALVLVSAAFDAVAIVAFRARSAFT